MSEDIDAPRLRFGRDRRLQRSAEFAQVRTEGKVQRGRFIVLGYLEREAASAFRAGFVTSRRVGGAVVRNRVRRRLREIVRRHQGELRTGLWMVCVARPAAAKADFAALEEEWLRLAQRAEVLRA